MEETFLDVIIGRCDHSTMVREMYYCSFEGGERSPRARLWGPLETGKVKATDSTLERLDILTLSQ